MSDLGPRLDPWSETEPPSRAPWAHGELRVGDRVRLRPGRSADIFDLELRGRTARVDAIVQDYDDEYHVAVVLEDDPGADLGDLRMPGHRFFYRPSEVEPP